MAGTYDGSTMTLYVDGEVSATMDAAGNIDGYDTPLFIGINGGRTEPMDGRIDDVRIYNHALDQTEIQAVIGMLPKNWSSLYERITESRSIFFKEFSHEKEV
jgi:hypothetical protein